MNYLLSILFILFLIISFYRNRDLFTSSKIYLIIVFTFFGNAFWNNDYELFIYFSVLCILLITPIIILIEKKIDTKTLAFEFHPRLVKSVVFRIWFLTLIPVFAQFLLFQKFGGVSFYISSISGRVVEWEGLGTIILFTKTINILNYLYFIFLIKIQKISKLNIYLYLVHLLIFVVIALLSGSRSNLLWNFVFMIIFYNYSVKKISMKFAFISFAGILLLATVIGVARGGYQFQDGKVSTGFSNSSDELKFSNFEYGIQPLNKIYESGDVKEYYYGVTYLTAITNLIPRSIWPKKPSSGGVIITNEYFGNPYGGYSNYTTGLIPEAIINFGYIGGFIFSFFKMMLLIIFLKTYQKKLQFLKLRSFKNYMFTLGIYPFILIGINSYTYTEFTTNTISLVVFKIIEFYFLFYFVISSKVFKIKKIC